MIIFSITFFNFLRAFCFSFVSLVVVTVIVVVIVAFGCRSSLAFLSCLRQFPILQVGLELHLSYQC